MIQVPTLLKMLPPLNFLQVWGNLMILKFAAAIQGSVAILPKSPNHEPYLMIK